jgi:hypothetical protein
MNLILLEINSYFLSLSTNTFIYQLEFSFKIRKEKNF